MTRRPPGDAVKKPDQLDVQLPAACVPALQRGGGLAFHARESHGPPAARTKAAARASRLDRPSIDTEAGRPKTQRHARSAGRNRTPAEVPRMACASSRGHLRAGASASGVLSSRGQSLGRKSPSNRVSSCRSGRRAPRPRRSSQPGRDLVRPWDGAGALAADHSAAPTVTPSCVLNVAPSAYNSATDPVQPVW